MNIVVVVVYIPYLAVYKFGWAVHARRFVLTIQPNISGPSCRQRNAFTSSTAGDYCVSLDSDAPLCEIDLEFTRNQR